MREPLIVRWPGVVAAGCPVDSPSTSPDFYPTLLAAGRRRPAARAALRRRGPRRRCSVGSTLDREAIYWHYPHYSNQGGTPTSAIRAGRWKLVQSFEGEREELFDLASDMGETTDGAADEPKSFPGSRRR